jgi:RNA polymerase sigma factor (sigma-70 family)
MVEEKSDTLKDLKIDSGTSNRGRDIVKFMPIIEMIARKELNNKSNKFISFDELVNTGLIAINKLIETAKAKEGTEYNSSYIAQSVKWAMKDEVRSRQAWYGVKTKAPGDNTIEREFDPTETVEIKNLDDARKAVFEVIMSVEGLEEDLGFNPPDLNHQEHLERLELLSMKKSLKKSIDKLPDNLKEVVLLRFYENKSGNEVAEQLGVTPSRISHMIKEATKRLRIFMVGEGY